MAFCSSDADMFSLHTDTILLFQMKGQKTVQMFFRIVWPISLQIVSRIMLSKFSLVAMYLGFN